MKLIEAKNYEQMCEIAASYISEKVRGNPNMTLGLATGGTPLGTYQKLIEDYQDGKTSYKQVVSFNLDEYIGLTGQNPNSYRYYMNDHFFNHIDIDQDNTFVPNGTATDLDQECKNYEEQIRAKGEIDLQLLGIGSNGHIGFNEPGASFESYTHVVELTESTREANSIYFERMEDVPKKAITMGIASIMKSKEILLLVSGEHKHDALAKLLTGNLTEQFPASILKQHPSVTIIADEAAIGNLSIKEVTYD
jgi:glucosamine-6-phosphate deaminase